MSEEIDITTAFNQLMNPDIEQAYSVINTLERNKQATLDDITTKYDTEIVPWRNKIDEFEKDCYSLLVQHKGLISLVYRGQIFELRWKGGRYYLAVKAKDQDVLKVIERAIDGYIALNKDNPTTAEMALFIYNSLFEQKFGYMSLKSSFVKEKDLDRHAEKPKLEIKIV